MRRPGKTDDPAYLAHAARTSAPTKESAFRELFLAQISNQEDIAAVRHVGKMLYTAALEVDGGCRDASEPYVATMLRAAVADLRRLEIELAEIGRTPEDFIVETPRELKLCRVATEKAFAVAKIADAIEKEIGPAPERGEKDPALAVVRAGGPVSTLLISPTRPARSRWSRSRGWQGPGCGGLTALLPSETSHQTEFARCHSILFRRREGETATRIKIRGPSLCTRSHPGRNRRRGRRTGPPAAAHGRPTRAVALPPCGHSPRAPRRLDKS